MSSRSEAELLADSSALMDLRAQAASFSDASSALHAAMASARSERESLTSSLSAIRASALSSLRASTLSSLRASSSSSLRNATRSSRSGGAPPVVSSGLPKNAVKVRSTHKTPSTSEVKGPTKSCYQGSFVTILVGPDEKVFTIHKDLLCFYSEYFRAAFNGGFKEASEQKLPLPEESVETFDIFHGWLYTRKLYSGPQDRALDFAELFRVWVFGDKHMIPLLQNFAMDAFLRRMDFSQGCEETAVYLPTDLIDYIYTNTPSGSALRRVMVDLAVYKGDVPTLMRPPHVMDWGKESLVDLVLACQSKGIAANPFEQSRCQYHIHDGEQRC